MSLDVNINASNPYEKQYPTFGSNDIIQREYLDTHGEVDDYSFFGRILSPFRQLWRDITGRNEQILGMAQQEHLLDREQEFTREMQNLQNEYNSPQNQIKMMMEAGLNPSSLFGSGQNFVSAGSPSSPSAPSSPSPEPAGKEHLRGS